MIPLLFSLFTIFNKNNSSDQFASVSDIFIRNKVIINGKCQASEFNNSYTNVYFDINRIIYNPNDFKLITDKLNLLYKNIVKGKNIPVCGLATAGISFATAIAINNQVPLMFVRKQSKGYGTNSTIEGGMNQKIPVVIVDDCIADPRQTLPFIEELRKNKIKILALICILEVLPPSISKNIFLQANIPVYSIVNYQQCQDIVKKNGK